MKIELPLLIQEIKDDQLISREENAVFDIDTSVYSEERWEQHFPDLCAKSSLFQYIERVQNNSISDRVKVAGMLKAIFCFIESDKITTYKQFAQMFSLSATEYTSRLIDKLKTAFKLVLGSSAVKN